MTWTSTVSQVGSISEDDMESLHRWVVAFCIIRFDLEKGQVVEECYPPGSITPEEELEIAFNSFPDSMSQNQNYSTIHDCMFFFRFPRRRASAVTSSSELQSFVPANEKSSTCSICISDFMYGYVFNRQRQDERLRRGGEQKSVVVLSHCPYSGVFKQLLQILGPLCFDMGKKALEYIATSVSSWPAPLHGTLMELPVGNATLKAHLPTGISFFTHIGGLPDVFPFVAAPSAAIDQSFPKGLFFEADLFGAFRGMLLQLWMLWELVLVGEPLLIIAPSPPQCCEAVASLVSLVAPLPLSIDFRPYFTIHDPDFAYLNCLNEKDRFPPMILGVTNLFFLKALRNVPHIVSVGCPVPKLTEISRARRLSPGSMKAKPDKINFHQLSLKKFSPSNLLTAVKLRRDGPLCLMTDHKEAIWSTYLSVIKPDITILNKLIDGAVSDRVEESVSAVNNEILRRHFYELTSNFLAPLGPYLRAKTPIKGVSPFADPPPLPSFSTDKFLKSLSERGPGKFLSKRMRTNWLDLYRRFLNGQNFMTWFQRRRACAEQEQQRLWKQARIKSDIQQFIPHMSELERVDSFNAIEKHLGELQQYEGGSSECRSMYLKLKNDLQAIFIMLPKDMQELLLINPQRASLLEGSSEAMKLSPSS